MQPFVFALLYCHVLRRRIDWRLFVAKEQSGDKAGADADIAAARKIDPDIGKR